MISDKYSENPHRGRILVLMCIQEMDKAEELYNFHASRQPTTTMLATIYKSELMKRCGIFITVEQFLKHKELAEFMLLRIESLKDKMERIIEFYNEGVRR